VIYDVWHSAMADPVSISASIIAILQLSAQVTQYLKDVQGGSEDRRKLRDEIRSSVCLLEMLRDRLEDAEDGQTWCHSINSLNTPHGPLDQFKQALESLVMRLAPNTRFKQVTQSLAWPFNKAEVAAALGAIERQKSLFNLALQNDHM
jgi:hypothetical protein